MTVAERTFHRLLVRAWEQMGADTGYDPTVGDLLDTPCGMTLANIVELAERLQRASRDGDRDEFMSALSLLMVTFDTMEVMLR